VQLSRVNRLNFNPALILTRSGILKPWCATKSAQCLKPIAQMIGKTLCDDETQSNLRDPCALLNLGSPGNSRDNICPNTYKFLEGR
jgi:hypothetical protein